MARKIETDRAKKIVTDTVSSFASENKLPEFIEDILTPQEIETIAERISLLGLLAKGKTQRDISERLGLGIQTVNRGSRVFQYGNIRNGWRSLAMK